MGTPEFSPLDYKMSGLVNESLLIFLIGHRMYSILFILFISLLGKHVLNKFLHINYSHLIFFPKLFMYACVSVCVYDNSNQFP